MDPPVRSLSSVRLAPLAPGVLARVAPTPQAPRAPQPAPLTNSLDSRRCEAGDEGDLRGAPFSAANDVERFEPAAPPDVEAPRVPERPLAVPWSRRPLTGRTLWAAALQQALLIRREYPQGGVHKAQVAAGWLWETPEPTREERAGVLLGWAFSMLPLLLFLYVPFAGTEARDMASVAPISLVSAISIELVAGSATHAAAPFIGTAPDSYGVRMARLMIVFGGHLAYFHFVGYHRAMFVIHYLFWGGCGFAPSVWALRHDLRRHDLLRIFSMVRWTLMVSLMAITSGLAYLLLFNMASTTVQPLVSILFGLSTFIVKWIARKNTTTEASYSGLMVSEVWNDPFSIAALMTSFPLLESPLGFAAVLASQMAGTAGLLLLQTDAVRPWFERLLLRLGVGLNPCKNDRVCRAVVRFELSCVAHIFTAAMFMLYLLAGRACPNAAFLPVGHWSDSQVQRGEFYVLIWLLAFPLFTAVLRPWIWSTWRVDAVRLSWIVWAEFTSLGVGLMAALPTTYMWLVLQQEGGVWAVYSENGSTA